MQSTNLYLQNLKQPSHALLLIQSIESNVSEFITNYIKKVIDLSIDDTNSKQEMFHKIDSNEYYDLIVFDGSKETIKKEDIIKIQNQFSRPGLEIINQKFYVLKNFEYSTKQAVNSLLKFLEEPIENTYCIITTSNISLILETIISRCQKILLETDKNELQSVVSQHSMNDIQQKLYLNSFNDIDELKLFMQTKDAIELNEWFISLIQKSLDPKSQKNLSETFKTWDYSKILFVLKCLSNYYSNDKKLAFLELIDELKYNPVKTLIFFKIIEIIKD